MSHWTYRQAHLGPRYSLFPGLLPGDALLPDPAGGGARSVLHQGAKRRGPFEGGAVDGEWADFCGPDAAGG